MLMLSKKYDISIIEVTKVKKDEESKQDRISKSYTVNLKEKHEDAINEQSHFNSKKQLVSWLMCLD